MPQRLELTEKDLAKLRDPRYSLPLYGSIIGQEYSDERRYDPFALTDNMQATILAYVGEPPKGPDGEYLFLVVLKSRQTGASTTCDLAFYPLTMYSPGHYHLTIADQKDRVDYLHTRIQHNHRLWPEELKVEQMSTNEIRRLSFENGAIMDVRSGGAHAVGVGQSPDSVHASEVPLWEDAETQYSLLMPAMVNRKHARFITESTPYPLSEPSSDFMKELCFLAGRREGRYIYAFFPFWDSKLNRRPHRGEKLDLEEQRLLDRYGHLGLQIEHLMFRRYMLSTDPKFRRDPRLFEVFYPFNDRDCWITSNKGIIPDRALARQSPYVSDVPEPDHGLWHFQEPHPGAIYVMGVDPAGYGRDHHAFQVLEVWDGEWEQVCSFGDECDPNEFYEIMWDTLLKYNRAYCIPERNGVGMGAIGFLRDRRYPNLMHDDVNKPGVHISSHDKLIELLVDSMMPRSESFTVGGELRVRGSDTFAQLQNYRGDRVVQQSVASAILGNTSKGRRKRHHWDKASALAIACLGARKAPRRYKDFVMASPGSWTYDQWLLYRRLNQPSSSGTDAIKIRRG